MAARGLLNLPSADASCTPNTNLEPGARAGQDTSGGKGGFAASSLVNKPNPAKDNMKSMGQTMDENATMAKIGAETGGHAYFNTNGLKEAVAAVVENGSSYYSIGYVPDAKSVDGKFHAIKLRVDNADYELSYRGGYYAGLPGNPSAHDPGSTSLTEAATQLGAPPATQIQFRARVLSASDPLLQGAKLPDGPAGEMASTLKVPLRRFIVDVTVDPHDLTFEQMPEGTYRSEISYGLFAYDLNGRRVNDLHQGFQVNLNAEQYARIMAADGANHIVPHRLAIDLPTGEIALRIIVYEPPTAHIGSLEVPVTGATR